MSGPTGSNPEPRGWVPHPPPPPSGVYGLPARPGRIVAAGAAIIGSAFAGMYLYMDWKHKQKAARDAQHPGSLPTWETRMKEHSTPTKGAAGSTTRRASDVATRATPLEAPTKEPDRAQHRTIASVARDGEGAHPLYAQNGARLHPTPQRDRGDGFAYTKSSVVTEPANGIKKEA